MSKVKVKFLPDARSAAHAGLAPGALAEADIESAQLTPMAQAILDSLRPDAMGRRLLSFNGKPVELELVDDEQLEETVGRWLTEGIANADLLHKARVLSDARALVHESATEAHWVHASPEEVNKVAVMAKSATLDLPPTSMIVHGHLVGFPSWAADFGRGLLQQPEIAEAFAVAWGVMAQRDAETQETARALLSQEIEEAYQKVASQIEETSKVEQLEAAQVDYLKGWAKQAGHSVPTNADREWFVATREELRAETLAALLQHPASSRIGRSAVLKAVPKQLTTRIREMKFVTEVETIERAVDHRVSAFVAQVRKDAPAGASVKLMERRASLMLEGQRVSSLASLFVRVVVDRGPFVFSRELEVGVNKQSETRRVA